MRDRENRSQLDDDKRQSLINRLSALLGCEDQILFAYLHGSFMENRSFCDFDLFMTEVKKGLNN